MLNGVSVACSTGPAVFVHSSPKKTVLYTAAGSVNLLSDGSGYIVEDAEQTEGEVYPNACVYACDDLRLDGDGTLRITGNADKGINTKDDTEITGGTLIVTSPGTAVRGNDSVEMTGGTVTRPSPGRATVRNPPAQRRTERAGCSSAAAVCTSLPSGTASAPPPTDRERRHAGHHRAGRGRQGADRHRQCRHGQRAERLRRHGRYGRFRRRTSRRYGRGRKQQQALHQCQRG